MCDALTATSSKSWGYNGYKGYATTAEDEKSLHNEPPIRGEVEAGIIQFIANIL
jgi:hypothetical protein